MVQMTNMFPNYCVYLGAMHLEKAKQLIIWNGGWGLAAFSIRFNSSNNKYDCVEQHFAGSNTYINKNSTLRQQNVSAHIVQY